MAQNAILGGEGLTANPGLIERERNDKLLAEALARAQQEREFQARYQAEQAQRADAMQARQMQMQMAEQERADTASRAQMAMDWEREKFGQEQDSALKRALMERDMQKEQLGFDREYKMADLASKQSQEWKPRSLEEALYLETAKSGMKPQKWEPRTYEEAIEFERQKAENKAPTQAQETTALYASRLKQANDVFDSLEGYVNKLPVVGTYLSGKVPNFMRDEKYQSYDQAQRNFLNAVLRRESGAVISPQEFENGKQQYFPQPGDSERVLEQKRLNRDLVMKNFIGASRNAYTPYGETQSSLQSAIGERQTSSDLTTKKQKYGLV